MNVYADRIQEAVDKHVHIDDIFKMDAREQIARMATISNEEFKQRFEQIENKLNDEIETMIKEVE
jgi:vacuolar-type H+-ATPase catalytic subunit A/Vma1